MIKMPYRKKDYSNQIKNLTGATDVKYLRKNIYIGERGDDSYYVQTMDTLTHGAGAVGSVVDEVVYGGHERGYIGVTGNIEIPQEVKDVAAAKGIGVLSMYEHADHPLAIIGAKERADVIYNNFVPQSIKEEIEQSPNKEEEKMDIVESFESTLEKRKVKDFPEEVIIFVVFAGILGSSLWYIIMFFLNLYVREFVFYFCIGISMGITIFIIYYFKKIKRSLLLSTHI